MENKILYTYNHLDFVLDIIRLEEGKKTQVKLFPIFREFKSID